MNTTTFDVFWGFDCSFFSKAKRHCDYMKLNKNFSKFFSFQSAKLKAGVFFWSFIKVICALLIYCYQMLFS